MSMKSPICVAGLLALLLAPAAAFAQVISFESAAVQASWYAPHLGYYQDSEDFQLSFSGAVAPELQLDFGLLRHARLRTAIGYWESSSRVDLSVDNPQNARRHTAVLRIVPISATILIAPQWTRRFQPVAGIGVAQNLIQRMFERTRFDGATAPESFAGNGRDGTMHALVGVHVPLAGAVWLGLESRYVWGRYEEERIGTSEIRSVALDGTQVGISIRYHVQ